MASAKYLQLTRWAIVLLAIAVGIVPIIPLAPSSDDPEAFSVDRALEHVELLAREPRPIGTVENVRVRNLIVEELRRLGLEPQLQAVEAPDYFGGTTASVSVVNVMARIRGRDSTKAIAIVGHFDSVPTTPGANDNAGAVAVMLEIARVTLSQPPLKNDLLLLFTDGEEPAPRFGAAAFVAEHPWFEEVGFVINLEAIGTAGPSLLIEVHGPTDWIVGHYAAAAPYPAAFSFVTATTELIGGSNTDFAPFRDAGVPGIEFAYLRGSSIYHTDLDQPGTVGRRSLSQHGANTLALAGRLGEVDLTSVAEEGQSVFFTLGADWVVRHDSRWLVGVLLASGAVLASIGWRARRDTGRAAGRMLIGSALTAGVAPVVWLPLATWRSSMGITESYIYLAGLIGLAVLIARVSAQRLPETPSRLSAVSIWWLLGAVTVAAAPGLSYLFVWPAGVASAVLAWRTMSSRTPSTWEVSVGLALVSVSTLVLVIPAIDLFFILAQPRPGNADSELLWAVLLPAILISMVVMLIQSFWDGRGNQLSARSR